MLGQSRFSELELVRRVAEASPGTGMGIEEIRTAVREVLTDRTRIVPLALVAGEPQFTTLEMLAVERQLLDAVERSRNAVGNAIDERAALAILNRYETLRQEQATAVRHVALGRDAIACVNGMAGTGKTFLLQVAREVWEASGREVIGTALAAKAAQTLEEGSGIRSLHLHSLIREIEQGKRTLSSSTVLVLDEAGMVGTAMPWAQANGTNQLHVKRCYGGVKRRRRISFGSVCPNVGRQATFKAQILRMSRNRLRLSCREKRDQASTGQFPSR